jgi:FkbM family methyltransferase
MPAHKERRRLAFVDRAFVRRLRTSGVVGGTVLNILRLLRLNESALRMIHRADLEHCREFFNTGENQRRIDSICRSLGDEQSVVTFLRAIRYQQSYRRCDAPKYTRDQYFADGVVSLSDTEVFVDCGAFTGDTVKVFLAECGGRYSRIVCFEPDPKNFAKLAKKTRKHKGLSLIQAGVWKESGTLQFIDGLEVASRVADANYSGHRVLVDVAAIDATEACRGVTYLKMDVEGAETEALLGAEETIRASRPKLAISIYHKPEDMLDIPEHLHSTFPGYKLYVRHHSPEAGDTVLYAIPDRWPGPSGRALAGDG